MESNADTIHVSVKEDKPAYILLGDDSGQCPPCDALKETLKAKLEDGTVRFVDINSEEGVALVQDMDPIELPQAYRTEDGARCELYSDGDTVLVKCGDSELIALIEPETKAD